MKERNITKNVLAQEIITDIGKRDKSTNVVIKLDLAKAYDKSGLEFLDKSSRKDWF